MLYVTTRVSQDAYTANRALSEDRCPEGGFFVPVRLPVLNAEQITALTGRSFSQNFAEILNLFFWIPQIVIFSDAKFYRIASETLVAILQYKVLQARPLLLRRLMQRYLGKLS